MSKHSAEVDQSPTVSIVVPSYNYARYLAGCLESILRQTVSDFEVIVIDDGSTDETATVLRRLTDRRIRRVVHTENQGLISTLNDGFRLARGRFVARLDADDEYRPDFLEQAIAIFDTHPDVGLFYGDVALIDRDGRTLEDPWQGIGSNSVHAGRDYHGDEYMLLLLNHCMPSPTVIGRREAWSAAFPIPEWFTYPSPSDWYLHLRVARTFPSYYRARTLASYRRHSENMHTQPGDARQAEESIIGTLDLIFSEPDHMEGKARWKGATYARAWLDAAHRYRAAASYAEARRCFFRALRHQPSLLGRREGVRHLIDAATGHWR